MNKTAEHEALQKVCVVLTEAIAGMLSDAGIGVQYAIVVCREGKDGSNLSAVGSNMDHATAAQTFTDVMKGFKDAAGH